MPMNEDTLDTNKAVVQRFNKHVIELGDEQAIHDLMAPELVNRTAAPASLDGSDGMTDQRISARNRSGAPKA
jgi:hypothetical protein